MNPAQAIPDFEAIWAEIQLLLEWQHDFGFYLVLSDDPRSARQLRQRVEDATRVWRFQRSCVVCDQNPGARGLPVRLLMFAAYWRLRDQWTPSPRVANQSVWPRKRR